MSNKEKEIKDGREKKMSGLFGTLGTANKGMNAQQIALQTTSHNIANANTEGYSRQQTHIEADSPYYLSGVGSIGTGVKVDSVSRIVDDYVVGQIRDENSDYQYYSQKSDVLGQLEIIFNASSTSGLTTDLNDFFNSWKDLGENPENGSNSRSIVLEKSNTLTSTINQMAENINDLSKDTLDQIEKNALDFNGKVKELQTLNSQLEALAKDGETPNDLLDKRDELLKDISSFDKIETSFDTVGRAFIKLNGQDVLTKDTIRSISVVTEKTADGKFLVSHNGNSLETPQEVSGDYQIGGLLLTDNSGSQTSYQSVEASSGIMKGLQESFVELGDRLNELNGFAYNLGTMVNIVHSGGTDLDENLFFDLGDTQDYASNIKVDDAIKADSGKIQAGKNGSDSESGDGSRATAISKLQDLKLKNQLDLSHVEYDDSSMSIKDQEAGLTSYGTFVDIVTKNGISKQQADSTMDSQEKLLAQLTDRRESISGVNINEEVSDIIRFQRAFQANARVISVVSEMLDTLINRTGV